MELDTSKYKTVVGYGVGEHYKRYKDKILQLVKPDYLCDRKWDRKAPVEYDGIPVIHKEQIKLLDNALIIIMVCNKWQVESIKNNLSELDADVVCISELFQEEIVITGAELKEKYRNGKYEDVHGNIIQFDETLSEKITICFEGYNNILVIEKNVAIINLYIKFGSNGRCAIGEGTELLGDRFDVSGAALKIGKDCLFAANVVLRTYDGHHIFDLQTMERINYPQNIEIGNQVWIAYGATLLGGARIGDGSVVGAGSVTSGEFEDHLVIAGSPARVIRRNICWSKDGEVYFEHQKFADCNDQSALKYL